jgi:hypothetical protein
LHNTLARSSEHIAFLLAAVKASMTAGGSELPPVAAHAVHPGARTIPVEAFYGWFRQGMPTDLEQLWAQPMEALRTVLKSAISENIISARFIEQIE